MIQNIDLNQVPDPSPESFPPILSVSALNRLIRNQLEQTFGEVWVEGEVSNRKVPSSGHLYFTLKDEAAQIRAVMFKSSFRRLKFDPEDGMRLLCRAEVTVYEPRGDYQLMVHTLEPRGIGALQIAFDQLKEKLKKEGLFDPDRKRVIPLLPKRIGIITSSSGAAIRDILQVLGRRFSNVEVLINPVLVQGEGAAQSIAQAIAEMNEIGHIDVLIVGRGGGSLEDLWAFNTEEVARAIHASRIPVISAVGHEVDYTISDFVADLRAPTPSAAAELVVQRKDELVERISTYDNRLKNAMGHRLKDSRSSLSRYIRALMDPRKMIQSRLQRLDELDLRLTQSIQNTFRHHRTVFHHLMEKLEYRNPKEQLGRLSVEITHYVVRMRQAIGYIFKSRRARLNGLMGQLDGLSPVAILSRGYSLTYRLPDKELMKDAQKVSQGDQILVRLHQGSIRGRVEEILTDREER